MIVIKKSFLSRIKFSNSFKNLTKGHLFSQILGFLFSILIAKIYGAQLLGTFSAFIALTTFFSCLNTLRLESILFLSTNKKDRQNNANSITILIIVNTFIISLFVLILTKINHKFPVSKIVIYLALIASIIKSIQLVLENITLLDDNYIKIKNSKILFTFIKYISQFSLFFFAMKNLGLIIGYLFSLIITLLYLYNKEHSKKIDLKRFVSELKKHIEILKYALPADTINVIATNVSPILIVSIYGTEIAGNYFMANLLLTVPLAFLQAVISPVFFKKSYKLYHHKKYKMLYNYTFIIVKKILFFVSIPILLFGIVGNELILFFLDEKWSSIGKFIQIYSFVFVFRVLYSPISSLEESLSKNKISLLINIYFIIILFGSFYLWKDTLSIFEIAFRISITTTLGYLFLLIYFFKLLHKKANLLLNK